MDIFLRFAAKTSCLPNNFQTMAYDARFIYIFSGEGEIRFKNKTITLHENSLCYYPSGTEYFPISSIDKPLSFVTINFDFSQEYNYITNVLAPVSCENFDFKKNLPTHLNCGLKIYQGYFVLHKAYYLRCFFAEIAQGFELNTESSCKAASSLLEFVCYRLTEHKYCEKNDTYHKTLDYIAENYRNITSNNDIAEALNYHSYYLNHIFKKNSGETIHKYLMDFKLKMGAEILQNTKKNVAEISIEVGFKNADHFSKCFSRKYGMPPIQFRKTAIFI